MEMLGGLMIRAQAGRTAPPSRRRRDARATFPAQAGRKRHIYLK